MVLVNVSVAWPARMPGHQRDGFAFDCHALEVIACTGLGGREAVARTWWPSDRKMKSIAEVVGLHAGDEMGTGDGQDAMEWNEFKRNLPANLG